MNEEKIKEVLNEALDQFKGLTNVEIPRSTIRKVLIDKLTKLHQDGYIQFANEVRANTLIRVIVDTTLDRLGIKL